MKFTALPNVEIRDPHEFRAEILTDLVTKHSLILHIVPHILHNFQNQSLYRIHGIFVHLSFYDDEDCYMRKINTSRDLLDEIKKYINIRTENVPKAIILKSIIFKEK